MTPSSYRRGESLTRLSCLLAVELVALSGSSPKPMLGGKECFYSSMMIPLSGCQTKVSSNCYIVVSRPTLKYVKALYRPDSMVSNIRSGLCVRFL